MGGAGSLARAKVADEAAFLLLVADLAVLRPTATRPRSACWSGWPAPDDRGPRRPGSACPVGVLEGRWRWPMTSSCRAARPAEEIAGPSLPGACTGIAPRSCPTRWCRATSTCSTPAAHRQRQARSGSPAAARATGQVRRRAPDAGSATPRSSTPSALVAEIIGHAVHPQQNLFDCGATSLHIVRLQRLLADQLGSRRPWWTCSGCRPSPRSPEPSPGSPAPIPSMPASPAPRAAARCAPNHAMIAVVGMAGRFPGAPDLAPSGRPAAPGGKRSRACRPTSCGRWRAGRPRPIRATCPPPRSWTGSTASTPASSASRRARPS